MSDYEMQYSDTKMADAVEKDLSRLDLRNVPASRIEVLRLLARALDVTTSARDIAPLTKRFVETLGEVREEASAEKNQRSPLDDMIARRRMRQAG